MTNRPDLSITAVRRCGLAAVVLAIASIPLAPLNALARMQTDSGRSDLANDLAAWWAEPALRTLSPWLLDFADVDTVYLTYGKFYLLAVLAVLACAVATRSRRPVDMGWAERWGWRLTIGSLALTCVGHFATYWLASVDAGFVVVLLSLLIGVFGNVLLGVGLIRAGFRPRVVQEITDPFMILTLVAAGVGVSLISDGIAEVMPSGSVFVPLAGPPTYLDHAIAWAADNPSPVLQAVLAVAEEVMPTPS